MWSKWHASSPSASGLRANDRRGSATPLLSFMIVILVGVILRLADFVAAAGTGRPIFPGAPGLRLVRLVARRPRRDLALGQRLRLASHAHGVHLHPRVARQIDRKPHHLDDRTRRRGKAVAA